MAWHDEGTDVTRYDKMQGAAWVNEGARGATGHDVTWPVAHGAWTSERVEGARARRMGKPYANSSESMATRV